MSVTQDILKSIQLEGEPLYFGELRFLVDYNLLEISDGITELISSCEVASLKGEKGRRKYGLVLDAHAEATRLKYHRSSK